MFLKTATMIAIAGVALSFLLQFLQQVMFFFRLYGDFYLTLSRLMSMLQLLLLHGGLLLFFIAFLLSLKAKTTT